MKGRNKTLIEERNKKIYERYFYWTEVKRIRFDDALKIVSQKEFFLSESRVLQIIRKMINDGYEPENGSALSTPSFTGFRFQKSLK